MDHTLEKVIALWRRRAGKQVITGSLQVLTWKNVGVKGTKEGVRKNADQSVEDKKEEAAHKGQREGFRGRLGMTFAKAEKQGRHCNPGGYKELGIAPTLGSISCGQVFNINNAMMYNLQDITFPLFWSISLARFPEVGLPSQNAGAL